MSVGGVWVGIMPVGGVWVGVMSSGGVWVGILGIMVAAVNDSAEPVTKDMWFSKDN